MQVQCITKEKHSVSQWGICYDSDWNACFVLCAFRCCVSASHLFPAYLCAFAECLRAECRCVLFSLHLAPGNLHTCSSFRLLSGTMSPMSSTLSSPDCRANFCDNSSLVAFESLQCINYITPLVFILASRLILPQCLFFYVWSTGEWLMSPNSRYPPSAHFPIWTHFPIWVIVCWEQCEILPFPATSIT